MISKYMLKEVLFHKEKYKDQIEITRLVLNKNYIEYTSDVAGNPYNYITHDEINVYELANKCKEWAFNNGYYLTIYNDAVDIILQTNCKLIENITDDSFKYSPMLVFKACQWILDNKENK